jgi:hypothetical protein
MAHSILSRFKTVLLEAEVSDSAMPDFIRQYMKLTGADPRSSEHCQPQSNKWGLEARLYFDGDDVLLHNLRISGYHVEDRSGGGYRSDRYPYRINSQQLFWAAVRHGYRLGPNAQIA